MLNHDSARQLLFRCQWSDNTIYAGKCARRVNGEAVSLEKGLRNIFRNIAHEGLWFEGVERIQDPRYGLLPQLLRDCNRKICYKGAPIWQASPPGCQIVIINFNQFRYQFLPSFGVAMVPRSLKTGEEIDLVEQSSLSECCRLALRAPGSKMYASETCLTKGSSP